MHTPRDHRAPAALRHTLTGAQVCVIGCGLTVGRPLGLMLTHHDQHATVTLCHEATVDVAAHTRVADVIVAAAGVAHLVRGDSVTRSDGLISGTQPHRRRCPGRRTPRGQHRGISPGPAHRRSRSHDPRHAPHQCRGSSGAGDPRPLVPVERMRAFRCVGRIIDACRRVRLDPWTSRAASVPHRG